ncbi:ABC transporter permease [Mycoplasmopsis iners]|uniref:ABC transporter permease n=1 Tax=Mycoplasmopsis iners TaxID=76630 RepID=UPI0004969C9B|nr:ABC transporter permease [Mycoplasmopsis iners]
MFKYILQRIAMAILALFIISFFVYVLVAIFAPDPSQDLAQELFEKAKRSGKTFEEIVAEIQARNGIRYSSYAADGTLVIGEKIPVIIRYLTYMGHFFKGEFGMPIKPENNPNPSEYLSMVDLFFKPLKYTLIITVPSMAMSLIGGITIGVFAGYKRGKLFDSVSNIIVLIFVAVPSFIIAPLVIAIGVKFGISPVVKELDENSFSVVFISYLPPILVITTGSLAAYVISTRNMVITVLTSNYVLIAKTKGLSASKIFFRYVLRNISIPLFGLIFGSFLGLLSGSVIIEQYWNVKGTSQVILRGFSTGELSIIMFSTIFFTAIGLAAAILTDLAYVVLDPKITYTSKSKKNYTLFFKAYLERRKMAKEYFANQAKGAN